MDTCVLEPWNRALKMEPMEKINAAKTHSKATLELETQTRPENYLLNTFLQNTNKNFAIPV